jgi:hypothetical protein
LELIATYENYVDTLTANSISAKTVITTTTSTGEENPDGFDTGGYTGEWGPSGKLAVLHQKEIVLNQDDTANLLQVVEMVRTIVAAIDMYSASA